jgi:hypothetical protein
MTRLQTSICVMSQDSRLARLPAHKHHAGGSAHHSGRGALGPGAC